MQFTGNFRIPLEYQNTSRSVAKYYKTDIGYSYNLLFLYLYLLMIFFF